MSHVEVYSYRKNLQVVNVGFLITWWLSAMHIHLIIGYDGINIIII